MNKIKKRRLAELLEKHEEVGGYSGLSKSEQEEFVKLLDEDATDE